MREADFVREMLELVRKRQPAMTERDVLEVEAEIRKLWGGQRPYIAKDMRRQHHVRAAVVADGLTSAATEELERKHGVSRSTIYRWLKKADRIDG